MQITGFGRSLTYRLLREGYLPSVRIRTHWYIPRTALQRYLDKIG
jgi:excisionase family DNA binding protein